MDNYLRRTLTTIEEDKGELLNSLIANGVISIEAVTRESIATNKAEYIYKFAMYVENAPIKKLASALFYLGYIDLLSLLHSKLIADKKEKAGENDTTISYIENLLGNLSPEPTTEIDTQALVMEESASFSEVNYSAFNDEQLFEELIKLYQSGNIEEIKKNREHFKRILDNGNGLKF